MSDEITEYGVSIGSDGAKQGSAEVVRSFEAMSAAAGGWEKMRAESEARVEANQRRLLGSQQQFATQSAAIDQRRLQEQQGRDELALRGRLRAEQQQSAAIENAYRQRQQAMARAYDEAYRLDAERTNRMADEERKREEVLAQEIMAITRRANAETNANGTSLKDAGIIRRELTSLIAQTTGTIPLVDRLGASLGSMAIGSNIMFGVLAGLAAVSAAYKLIGKDAQEAAEREDAALKKLIEWDREKNRDSGGKFGGEVNDATSALARKFGTTTNISSSTAQIGGAYGTIGAGAYGLFFGPTQKKFAEEVRAIADGRKAVGDETTKLFLEQHAKEVERLSDLVTFGQATKDQRARLLDQLKQDEVLFAQYQKAASAPGLSGTQRATLEGFADQVSSQIGREKTALFPDDKGFDSAAGKLDHIRDSVRMLHDEAANFGRDGSIDTRLATINTQLDNLGTQYPKLAPQIEALRADVQASGDAMKQAAYDKVAKDIHEQYVAQKQLTESYLAGAGSVNDLSVAQRASNEIREREKSLGKELNDQQRQEITQRIQLAANLKDAEGTRAIADHAQALAAENAAMASGASDRKTYAADLEFERQIKEALKLTDVVQFAQRMAAITALHAEAVEHDRLSEAIRQHDEAVKKATQSEKTFRDEQSRFAATMQNEVMRSIEQLTGRGLRSYESFFQGIERSLTHTVATVNSEIAKLNGKLEDAIYGGSKEHFDEVLAEVDKLTNLRNVLGVAAAGIGGGLYGYQVGQQTGNSTTGALGGAAAGALAGSEFGPWGAAIGGLMGAAGGLLGAADAQKQAAEALLRVQADAQKNADSFHLQATGNSVGAQLAQIKDTFNQLWAEMVKANGGVQPAGFGRTAHDTTPTQSDFQRVVDDYNAMVKKASDDFFGGIAQQLNALKGPAGDYENQLAAIEKAYHDNIEAAKALNATNEQLQQIEDVRTQSEKKLADAMAQTNQRALEDLDVRYLRAEGYGQKADDQAFRLAQQRELQDARTRGESDEYLAKLTRDQFAEAIQREQKIAIDNQTKAIQEAAAKEDEVLAAQLKTAQDALQVAQDQLQAQQQQVQATQQAYNALTQFAAGLSLNTGLTVLSPIEQLAEAKRQYDQQVALAKGGDRTAASGLSSYAQTFLSDSRAVNASGTDYVATFMQVQQDLTALSSQYGGALSVEQQQLQEMQRQTAALNQQINAISAARAQAAADAQAQINAINQGSLAIRKSLDSLPGATDPFGGGSTVPSDTAAIASGVTGTNNRLDLANTHLSANVTVNQSGHAGTQAMLGAVANRIDALSNAIMAMAEAQSLRNGF